jgi:hypothetical protein
VIANIDHGTLQLVRPDSCFRSVAIESLQACGPSAESLMPDHLTGSDLE